MKRSRIVRASVLALAVSALASAASAQLSFDSTNYLLTRPASGSVTYTLSGSLSVPASRNGGTGYSGLFAPMDADGHQLAATIDPAFVAAFDAVPSAISYTGPIVRVTVSADDPLGVYGSDPYGTPGGVNNGGYVDFAYDGNASGSPFKVTVQAVPEPATMAALGLGGLAALRRRKRA